MQEGHIELQIKNGHFIFERESNSHWAVYWQPHPDLRLETPDGPGPLPPRHLVAVSDCRRCMEWTACSLATANMTVLHGHEMLFFSKTPFGFRERLPAEIPASTDHQFEAKP